MTHKNKEGDVDEVTNTRINVLTQEKYVKKEEETSTRETNMGINKLRKIT